MAPKKFIPEGSRALHSLNPNRHKSDIVESSVRHMERKTGEKANNAEEKIGAFISRITPLEVSLKFEGRLAERITNELVIQPEDIPETYWEQQQQIARDNGLGNVELSEAQKAELVDELQDAQRTGIDSWINYFQNDGFSYPVWFKVYALEGMASLTTFNTEKGMYNRRSKGSVAPYPQLDKDALSKTYNAVEGTHEYGDDAGNQSVAALLKGGNFNKIYSHYLIENKSIIATPENPEDVYGEWKEYTADDLDAIKEAAQGTPWCIAGGHYAQMYTENDGKFYLFHLKDKETGVVSPTAAASIRMSKGSVVEVSGLGPTGQAVEDSLVPEVFQKAASLPGGERYMEAFQDKQHLILMDKKVKAGEAFNADDLRFLYEFDRKIVSLNYGQDSRVSEFRKPFEDLIDDLVEADMLDEYVEKMGDSSIIRFMDKLLDYYPAEKLVERLSSYAVEDHLHYLLNTKVDPTLIAQRLNRQAIGENWRTLKDAGVDLEKLMARKNDEDDNVWLERLKGSMATVGIPSIVGRKKANYFGEQNSLDYAAIRPMSRVNYDDIARRLGVDGIGEFGGGPGFDLQHEPEEVE